MPDARERSLPRLAVLRDFREEGWASMDLAAHMLIREINAPSRGGFRAVEVCPPFRRLTTRLSALRSNRTAFNADRLLNRFYLYPRDVRRRAGRFDLFHLCDHSYAQLLHVLPAGRVGVFCHDLDTFRCVLEPQHHPRPLWFRKMACSILRGLQKAAVVFHSTDGVREEILRHGLCDADRLVKAPYGVCPEFTPGELVTRADPPLLLHVGSCIPRKRIDVLLDVFAELRKSMPELRLVQIGGRWTAEQSARIGRLGIRAAVEQRRGLTREELAELYWQASLVVQPSEAEGFGLPVVEALACGACVLASDIPPLREVAGDAATYCPVGEIDTWVRAARQLLERPLSAPPLEQRLAQAARFSWTVQADIITSAYRRLLES